MKKLLIIGASGHGKVVADIAENCGYEDIAFLDDNGQRQTCMGYPVVGRTADADLYPNHDIIVAIGNPNIREQLQTRLEAAGHSVPVLIHPKSVIGRHVSLAAGTVVMAGAVINPNVRIGRGCIINTCASVDHDNILGDFVHISVGSHLAGAVAIGDRTWIGIGASVSNNLTLSSDCMIGAGAVVVKSISVPGTYAGVPAKSI